jgi:hypothetical protein
LSRSTASTRPRSQIVVDDLVVLVERDLDAGVLQQVEGVGLVEGRDPFAAQVGQGPIGRAGPHRQGLGVDEVRARQEDRRGPGRSGLEAVAHHVDVAAAQERHQVDPVEVTHLGADPEAARHRVHDLDLEADQPTVGGPPQERLAALEIGAPGQDPGALDPGQGPAQLPATAAGQEDGHRDRGHDRARDRALGGAARGRHRRHRTRSRPRARTW